MTASDTNKKLAPLIISSLRTGILLPHKVNLKVARRTSRQLKALS